MSNKVYTISQMFDYFPGNFGLTEEIIYAQKPTLEENSIPIFSGSGDNESPIGFILDLSVTSEGEPVKVFTGPALILTKDGSAGMLTYKPEGVRFTINHHACVIKRKNEFHQRLNEKWFLQQYQSDLLKVVTSQSDNRIFSLEWFERLRFLIPDRKIQDDLCNKKTRLEVIRNALSGLRDDVLAILNSPYKSVRGEKVKASTIFDVHSGNSGLTEEWIYNNQPTSSDEAVEVLSSATLAANSMGLVAISVLLPTGESPKIFTSECILLARNGYAGAVTYIGNKKFMTNDHAYILIPKDMWKKRINLRWFAFQYKHVFRRVATSQSDNATFNKDWLGRLDVRIPERQYQDRIAEKLYALDDVVYQADLMINQIGSLLQTPFDLTSFATKPARQGNKRSLPLFPDSPERAIAMAMSVDPKKVDANLKAKGIKRK